MSKLIDGLKSYYRYKHGRISAKDIWTIADEFIQEKFTNEQILAQLLASGYDVKTTIKILNAVDFAGGEE